MELNFVKECMLLVIIHCREALGGIVYNTLSTTLDRSTIFVSNVTEKTCLLEPDEGPCRGNIKMYYYDPESGSCGTFKWGGCQGNGNRFDTKSECYDYCKTKSGNPKVRPRWCYLSFDYGFCFGGINRWYYDSTWKVCKERIYSGCGGNQNNFYSLEECERICRFGLGTIKSSTDSKGIAKKVVIINPYYTTPRRGRNQRTTPKANNTGT